MYLIAKWTEDDGETMYRYELANWKSEVVREKSQTKKRLCTKIKIRRWNIWGSTEFEVSDFQHNLSSPGEFQ